MMEITICGRGGQGGVTLAKIIASAYFLKGKYVQAFGVYAAERSGAPIQAFIRVDDEEITNHNQVQHPDHIVVLDRTLITSGMDANMKPGGFIVINTPPDKNRLPGAFYRSRCVYGRCHQYRGDQWPGHTYRSDRQHHHGGRHSPGTRFDADRNPGRARTSEFYRGQQDLCPRSIQAGANHHPAG